MFYIVNECMGNNSKVEGVHITCQNCYKLLLNVFICLFCMSFYTFLYLFVDVIKPGECKRCCCSDIIIIILLIKKRDMDF